MGSLLKLVKIFLVLAILLIAVLIYLTKENDTAQRNDISQPTTVPVGVACFKESHRVTVRPVSDCFGNAPHDFFFIPNEYNPVCISDNGDFQSRRSPGEPEGVKMTVSIGQLLPDDKYKKDQYAEKITLFIPILDKSAQITGCKKRDTSYLLKKVLDKKNNHSLLYEKDDVLEDGERSIVGIKDSIEAKHSYSVYFKRIGDGELAYAAFCYTVNNRCVVKEILLSGNRYVFELDMPIIYSDDVFKIVEASLGFLNKLNVDLQEKKQ